MNYLVGIRMTIIPVLLSLYPSAVCGNSGLSVLDWLVGDCVSENEKNITFESWKKVSIFTFEGTGSTQSGSNHSLTNVEYLRILEMSDQIFYLAKVPHNEFPISFKLTEFSDSSFVFENPRHDFPKVIEYQLHKNGKMFVTVSNESRKFSIEFVKKNGK